MNNYIINILILILGILIGCILSNLFSTYCVGSKTSNCNIEGMSIGGQIPNQPGQPLLDVAALRRVALQTQPLPPQGVTQPQPVTP